MKHIFAKIIKIVSVVLAVALLVIFLLRAIDASFPFISKVQVLADIVGYALTYGFLILTALVAISSALNKSWILALLVLILVVAILVFTFLPGALGKLGL